MENNRSARKRKQNMAVETHVLYVMDALGMYMYIA